MSTIFFCGDPHGRFRQIIAAVHQHRPDAVVLLGDLQAMRPLEVELADILERTEIWFIHGNHDTDSDRDYDNLFGSALAERNLHGRVVEVAGVRIAGLGGVFREKIWRPPEAPHYASAADFQRRMGQGNRWRGGLPRIHHSTIFAADVERLAQQRADVLVSHEAPSVRPRGFEAIDLLARSLRVHTSFHGHHHDRPDYSAQWPRLGFSAHSVGLGGISDLTGAVIHPGEEDEIWAIEARRPRRTTPPEGRP